MNSIARILIKNTYRNWNIGLPIQIIRNFAAEEKCPPERGKDKKGLVVGVYEGCSKEPVFTVAGDKLNDKTNGRLAELVTLTGNLFQRGQCRIFHNMVAEYWGIAVVGLGVKELGFNEGEQVDEGREAIRAAAALGALELQKERVAHIQVEGFGNPETAAEGSALAVWTYQENKARQMWKIIPTLELHDDTDFDAWERGLFKAEAQNLARRLSDTPANQLTPTAFAQQIVNLLCPCGIKVEVHDKDWIEAKKLTALLTVARGSCEPPVYVEMVYCGGPTDARPICLVGKGITFDSGGISLKRKSGYLGKYRADMCGGAVVVAVLRAAAALSLPLNIVGVVPICENMVSGMAMRPGDIVFSVNGKSIMIEDTDNEGQLMLADALAFTQLCHKPRMLIDIASMTTGIRQALGTSATGVYSNSEQLWTQMVKASYITGDRVWRFPLWNYFRYKSICFPEFDVHNVGIGDGEPSLCAGFLSEFVECVDWIHLDVSGSGKNAVNQMFPYYRLHRMTGRPTRTLIQFLYQVACPGEEEIEEKC